MCTPVCIPLAASVRMISAVIASSAGTEAKPERVRRPAQPVQVLVEREDPAVGQPQALPDRVPALHDRVERGHPRLVPVRQAAADVDDQVAVALVELLQHEALLTPFGISILILFSLSRS